MKLIKFKIFKYIDNPAIQGVISKKKILKKKRVKHA